MSKKLLDKKVQRDEILKEIVMADVSKEYIVKNDSEPNWKNKKIELRGFKSWTKLSKEQSVELSRQEVKICELVRTAMWKQRD